VVRHATFIDYIKDHIKIENRNLTQILKLN
jgi:hypothetical protein